MGAAAEGGENSLVRMSCRPWLPEEPHGDQIAKWLGAHGDNSVALKIMDMCCHLQGLSLLCMLSWSICSFMCKLCATLNVYWHIALH
jgi:hypothetical protein